MTNLTWQLHSGDIAQQFSIPTVKLINDFEAAALAVEALSPDDLVTLQTGHIHEQAMRVVLGAGTGMGVAWLTCLNDRYYAFATEAGHMDFAPTNELQIPFVGNTPSQIWACIGGASAIRIGVNKYFQLPAIEPGETFRLISDTPERR